MSSAQIDRSAEPSLKAETSASTATKPVEAEKQAPIKKETKKPVKEASVVKAIVARSKPILLKAGVFAIFVNVLALFPAVFSLQVYDRVIFRNGMNTLTAMLIGMSLILALDLILRSYRGHIMRNLAVQMDTIMSKALLDKMMKVPLRVLESRPAESWYTLFKDIDSVRIAWSGQVATNILDLPFAIIAIAIIYLIAQPVLPVLLVGLGLLVALSWWSSSEFRKRKVEEFGLMRQKDAVVAEICQSREAIKTLVQDKTATARWVESYRHWVEESYTKNGSLENQKELASTIMLVVNVCITAVGAIAVIGQEMTIGGLIATNMLSSKAIQPLAALCNNFRSMAQAREAADRLDEVFAYEEEIEESGIAVPSISGKVSVKKMSYTHEGSDRPILDTVNLDIPSKGLYAIAGSNGSGKTTLLKILRGLYTPQQGRVFLDEYDIAQFSREEMAKLVGYLPQESLLFKGTILENIKRMAPDASDLEIQNACKMSGAHEFIATARQGFGTEVGEGGNRLSGGQKRKIALAMTYLRNTPVLLLDEPSNHLDFQSENQLRSMLMKMAETRTIIMVTHSVRLMASAEKVIHVGKDGSVAIKDTREVVKQLFGIDIGARKPTEAEQALEKAKKAASGSAPTNATSASVVANNETEGKATSITHG